MSDTPAILSYLFVTVASLAVRPDFHTIGEGVSLTGREIVEIVETAIFKPSGTICFRVDKFIDEK